MQMCARSRTRRVLQDPGFRLCSSFDFPPRVSRECLLSTKAGGIEEESDVVTISICSFAVEAKGTLVIEVTGRVAMVSRGRETK